MLKVLKYLKKTKFSVIAIIILMYSGYGRFSVTRLYI